MKIVGCDLFTLHFSLFSLHILPCSPAPLLPYNPGKLVGLWPLKFAAGTMEPFFTNG